MSLVLSISSYPCLLCSLCMQCVVPLGIRWLYMHVQRIAMKHLRKLRTAAPPERYRNFKAARRHIGCRYVQGNAFTSHEAGGQWAGRPPMTLSLGFRHMPVHVRLDPSQPVLVSERTRPTDRLLAILLHVYLYIQSLSQTPSAG